MCNGPAQQCVPQTCETCGTDTRDDVLLVCDDCERLYHTFCLDPRLERVPEGGWKCADCVKCIECGATGADKKKCVAYPYCRFWPMASQVLYPNYYLTFALSCRSLFDVLTFFGVRQRLC